MWQLDCVTVTAFMTGAWCNVHVFVIEYEHSAREEEKLNKVLFSNRLFQ